MVSPQTDHLALRDFMSEAGITKWIAALGVPDAPFRREGIRAALSFFAQNMSGLSTDDAIDFLFAMDLTKPVRPVYLWPGEKLVAFRHPTESPFKLFFARPGASVHQSGVDVAGRSIARFVVRASAPALESVATSVVVTWGGARGPAIAPRKMTYGPMGFGGGAQLLVPQSYSSVLVQTP